MTIAPAFQSDRVVESSSQPFLACFTLSGESEVEVVFNVTSAPESAFREYSRACTLQYLDCLINGCIMCKVSAVSNNNEFLTSIQLVLTTRRWMHNLCWPLATILLVCLCFLSTMTLLTATEHCKSYRPAPTLESSHHQFKSS